MYPVHSGMHGAFGPPTGVPQMPMPPLGLPVSQDGTGVMPPGMPRGGWMLQPRRGPPPGVTHGPPSIIHGLLYPPSSQQSATGTGIVPPTSPPPSGTTVPLPVGAPPRMHMHPQFTTGTGVDLSVGTGTVDPHITALMAAGADMGIQSDMAAILDGSTGTGSRVVEYTGTGVAAGGDGVVDGIDGTMWTEHKAKDGRIFWHSNLTGKSTWEKPDELKSADEVLWSSQTPWKQYTAVDGRNFWFNKDTKESVWDTPEAVLKAKEEMSQQEVWTTPFDDKSEARKKLKVLFEQKDFSVKTRWEEALKLIQADPRYKLFSILASGEKKQVYTEFLTYLQRRAKEEVRVARIKARETIVEAVNSWKNIHPAARYSDFAQDHHEQPWWSKLDERERVDLYQESIEEYERDEWSDSRRLKHDSVIAITERLDQLENVTFESSWTDVLKKINKDVFFEKFDMTDILTCWQNYVYKSDKQDRDRRRGKAFRLFRRRRQKLLAVFRTMAADGRLCERDVWPSFFKKNNMDANPAYYDMLGQPGSAPWDLWNEIYDSVCTEYDSHKSLVKKCMCRTGVHVSPESTFEWFDKLLHSEAEYAAIPKGNAKLVFEHLLKKAKRSQLRAYVSPPAALGDTTSAPATTTATTTAGGGGGSGGSDDDVTMGSSSATAAVGVLESSGNSTAPTTAKNAFGSLATVDGATTGGT
eukprot:Lankesteria_metandrocarpae@DN1974_c0_g1_i1.p1